MLNQIEADVLKALEELETSVKSMATANPKPNLLPIFTQIDQLAGQLPSETDPELLHYLRKKSYEKARLWLEGRRSEITRGGCRND